MLCRGGSKGDLGAADPSFKRLHPVPPKLSSPRRYLSMFFIVLVFIRASFYVLFIFIVCFLSFGCSS